MQKLTVIVNCTDRKTIEPHTELRIRTLPSSDDCLRFATWRERIVNADTQVDLLNLYKGEAWLQAKALTTEARRSYGTVRMLVASAGLGLRSVTYHAPSYAATFATGQADSVTRDVKQLQAWWRNLGDLPAAVPTKRHANESVLLVLSENYARAMDDDLQDLAQRGGDYLLVGGWRTIDGLPRLAADRDLRQSLGGTVSSLNLRMARKWLARRSQRELFTTADAKRWSRWARTARRSEVYDRTSMTDGEIIKLIREILPSDPDLSATRALRRLRDSGIACEQKRFGYLFKDAVERNE